MTLDNETLEQIGSYVKRNVVAWLAETEYGMLQAQLAELSQRTALIATELKATRELMDARFEAVDRRFDAVDARFEAVDRRFTDLNSRFEDMHHRFNSMQWLISAGFVALATLVTVFHLIG